MNKHKTAGVMLTVSTAEEYFKRVIEAEKKMGPLSRDERLIILKSLGSEISIEDLLDMMEGKRILIVQDKNNEKA